MRRRDVRGLLQSHGIRASAALGQNFLTDPNLLEFIVRTADVNGRDVVLEIGTGTAGLALPLARAGRRLITVEVHPGLADMAEQLLAEHPNVELIRGDVLAGKHAISPAVLEAVERALEREPDASLKLVANLPYSIATPAILALLECGLRFERMVVMVQKEVGERLAAGPGDPAYGAPSVLARHWADVTIVRTVPPQVFFPRPKVDSAIVEIVPRAEPTPVRDYDLLVHLVRTLYSGRRKTVGTVLRKWRPTQEGARERGEARDRGVGARALERAGIDPGLRPERIGHEQMARLADALDEERQAGQG